MFWRNITILLWIRVLSILALSPRTPYTNTSNLPLYGITAEPQLADITSTVSPQGWFEALLGALLSLTGGSRIVMDLLSDPGNGTIIVSVGWSTAARPKAFWGNSTSGVAWPSALYTGLASPSFDAMTNLEYAHGLLLGTPMSPPADCVAPYPSGLLSNLSVYSYANIAPVLALVSQNATSLSIADRFIHLLPQSASTPDTIYYGGISLIDAHGPSIRNISLEDWLKSCQEIYT